MQLDPLERNRLEQIPSTRKNAAEMCCMCLKNDGGWLHHYYGGVVETNFKACLPCFEEIHADYLSNTKITVGNRGTELWNSYFRNYPEMQNK